MRTLQLLIRTELVDDYEAIRQVHRLAFGQEAEGKLVDALREGGYNRLSLVAEDLGQIVGHILFSDLVIQTATSSLESLALAPMAVIPEYQRMGVGSALVRTGLKSCQEQGHKIVVVLGHTEFYPRFGFTSKLAEQLICSFYSGPALMAKELVPGALRGIRGELKYSSPFESL